MIKQWLLEKLIKNHILFIKNNGEYMMVENIVFDDGDIEVVIFESKPIKKTNKIRTG